MEWLEGHLREAQRSLTLVMVTHDEDLAERAATRIVRMKDGLVVG